MNARTLSVVVTGGRHYVLRADDFLLIEATIRAVGAKTICTDGSIGVAEQVEAWASQRGMPVLKVTANWLHEGPACARGAQCVAGRTCPDGHRVSRRRTDRRFAE